MRRGACLSQRAEAFQLSARVNLPEPKKPGKKGCVVDKTSSSPLGLRPQHLPVASCVPGCSPPPSLPPPTPAVLRVWGGLKAQPMPGTCIVSVPLHMWLQKQVISTLYLSSLTSYPTPMHPPPHFYLLLWKF